MRKILPLNYVWRGGGLCSRIRVPVSVWLCPTKSQIHSGVRDGLQMFSACRWRSEQHTNRSWAAKILKCGSNKEQDITILIPQPTDLRCNDALSVPKTVAESGLKAKKQQQKKKKKPSFEYDLYVLGKYQHQKQRIFLKQVTLPEK